MTLLDFGKVSHVTIVTVPSGKFRTFRDQSVTLETQPIESHSLNFSVVVRPWGPGFL